MENGRRGPAKAGELAARQDEQVHVGGGNDGRGSSSAAGKEREFPDDVTADDSRDAGAVDEDVGFTVNDDEALVGH